MAEPLTMTPEREAWYRSPEGIACAPLYTPDLLAELDATRAKLAEAEARVAALTEALADMACCPHKFIGDCVHASSTPEHPVRAILAALYPPQDAKG